MTDIAPSLLSADMARLSEAVEMVRAEANYIHCDVMDGHFVPNLTFGAPIVAAVKKISDLPLDVHLMIERPARWIDDYLRAGLGSDDFLTFHIEAEEDAKTALCHIRDAGVKSGIALKPGTPIEEVVSLLGDVDQVLIMTVEPGFGGQKFMVDMLEKVRFLRAQGIESITIGIDGGIDVNTAPMAAAAGADLLVAGSAIYGSGNAESAIRELRMAIDMTTQDR